MVRLTKIFSALAVALLTALIARPSTAAVTINSTAAFNGPFVDPCNNDVINSVGLLHVLGNTTTDSAGVHTTFHFNESDTHDTDLNTGQTCADTGALNENTLNLDCSGGPPCIPTGGLPITVTLTFNGTESCPGSAASFEFQELVHATVNADGTLTVLLSNAPGVFKCK